MSDGETFGYTCMTVLIIMLVWYLVTSYLKSSRPETYDRWCSVERGPLYGIQRWRRQRQRRRSSWAGDEGAQWDEEFVDFVDVTPELGYEPINKEYTAAIIESRDEASAPAGSMPPPAASRTPVA